MMQKTILLTGSTDGIGFEAAKILVEEGHHVLIHGRNPKKLADVQEALVALSGDGTVASFVADLSCLAEVEEFAIAVKEKYKKLDVLINNAGVYKVSTVTTKENLYVRFVVNESLLT